MRHVSLVAAVFLVAGAFAMSAAAQGWYEVEECEEFDSEYETTVEDDVAPSYDPWTRYDSVLSYDPYAGYAQDYNPYAGYSYGQDGSSWTPYSTWSSGEVYGDGSSTLYQNYGGGDSTSMYYGNDGDMIVNAGGEMWWPGK